MPHQKRILVIDDQEDQWQLIRAAIASSIPDAEAVWVSNLGQALDYLQAQSAPQLPNLILLDLYLPGRADGWQCLESLREGASFLLLPTVIFSHSDLVEDIDGSYDRGCSSYIVKTADPRQWLHYFAVVHNFWWGTATLPPNPFYLYRA